MLLVSSLDCTSPASSHQKLYQLYHGREQASDLGTIKLVLSGMACPGHLLPWQLTIFPFDHSLSRAIPLPLPSAHNFLCLSHASLSLSSLSCYLDLSIIQYNILESSGFLRPQWGEISINKLQNDTSVCSASPGRQHDADRLDSICIVTGSLWSYNPTHSQWTWMAFYRSPPQSSHGYKLSPHISLWPWCFAAEHWIPISVPLTATLNSQNCGWTITPICDCWISASKPGGITK